MTNRERLYSLVVGLLLAAAFFAVLTTVGALITGTW